MTWASCALVLLLLATNSYAQNAKELHSHNSEKLFEGSWLVMFYAPWCPACQELKPMWEKLATEKQSDSLQIAQIDVNRYPALSGQFLIFNLPSIYYIHDGECKQYLGLHDMSYITSWVDNGGWKDAEPIPEWRAPNSVIAKSVGKFFNFANHIRTLKNTLVEDYGIPSWMTYAMFVIGTILLGLMAGITLVCLCDCIFPPPKEEEVDVTDDRIEEETEEEEEGDEGDGKAEGAKKKSKKSKSEGDTKDAKKSGDGKLRKRKK